MKFPIAIEPGDNSHAYGVVVPDLPGCFSAGDTIEYISPHFPYKKETGWILTDEEGRSLETAGHGRTVFIRSSCPISPGDILRKEE